MNHGDYILGFLLGVALTLSIVYWPISFLEDDLDLCRAGVTVEK